MSDLFAIVKEIGLPTALCVVMLYAIRHMASTLVRAYTDRISALERAVAEMHGKHEIAQRDLLDRSDQHKNEIRELTERYERVTREHSSWNKRAFESLTQLINLWQDRPCLAGDDLPSDPPHRHRRPPSRSDLHMPPEPPTEGISR